MALTCTGAWQIRRLTATMLADQVEHAMRETQPRLLIEATRNTLTMVNREALVKNLHDRGQRGRGFGAERSSAVQAKELFADAQGFLAHDLRWLKRLGGVRIGSFRSYSCEKTC